MQQQTVFKEIFETNLELMGCGMMNGLCQKLEEHFLHVISFTKGELLSRA